MVNLFLIGAPKTGTTTIFEYFKRHDEIFVPEVKEPSYFSRSNLTTWFKNKRAHEYMLDYKAYLDLFKSGYKYKADCSTSYLRTPESLKEIKKSSPNCKILILLRNPYELVVSWHYQKVKEGQEKYYDFKEAWLNSTLGEEIDASELFKTDALDYKKVGKIGSQIEYVLQVFSKEDVLILNHKELNAPKSLLDKIARFLSISPFESIEIKANVNKPIPLKVVRTIKRKSGVLAQFMSFIKRYIPKSIQGLFYKNYYSPKKNVNYLKNTGYFDDEICKVKKLTGINL